MCPKNCTNGELKIRSNAPGLAAYTTNAAPKIISSPFRTERLVERIPNPPPPHQQLPVADGNALV